MQLNLGWKARGSGGLAWKRARSPLLNAYDQSVVDDHRTASIHEATRGAERAPLAGRDVRGNAHSLAGKRGLGLCVKCLDSSCEESVSVVQTHDVSAAPATKQGATEVQLEPGSNSVRPRAVMGERMTTLRARYRSHSSFVDGKDKHLDEISRQGIADNLTPRLRTLDGSAQ